MVTIRLRDPATANSDGQTPTVHHVDLIVGEFTGKAINPATNSNSTARVEQRFNGLAWSSDGEYLSMSKSIRVENSQYVRVRGTNTDEFEPEQDPPAENPWKDLWFYSNPVFITAK
jgi:hypothetical protein